MQAQDHTGRQASELMVLEQKTNVRSFSDQEMVLWEIFQLSERVLGPKLLSLSCQKMLRLLHTGFEWGI